MAEEHKWNKLDHAGKCTQCGLPIDIKHVLPQCSKLTAEHYHWIQDATIKEMEERSNRMHPGDTIFIGNMGRYFLRELNRKREEDISL